MSFEKRDFKRGGANSYFPLYDWINIPEPFGVGEQNCVEYVLESQAERITDIFEHLYFPFATINEDGEETIEYLDCGLTNNEIYQDFLATYGELPFLKPYYWNNEDATKASITKLIQILQSTINQNYFKYKKLAATLGFTYNPIHNYEMKEEGKDTETPTGTETNTHTINQTSTGFVEIEGPASQISLSPASSTTGLKTVDFSMADTTDIGYSEQSVSDVEAGKKANTSGIPQLGDGTTPTTNNYTTTMDDASTGRLESYQTTTGTTAQAQNVKGYQERPAVGHIKIGSEHPSYTDTKTYTQYKKDTEHTFGREGNIGVMST